VLAILAFPYSSLEGGKTVQLKIMRHLWGVTEPFESAFPKFKELGYVGVEEWFQVFDARLMKLLDAERLQLIVLVGSHGDSVEEHLRVFAEQVEQAKALGPILINAHSGSDRFSAVEAKRFYEGALKIEQSAGIPIAHETHRGRVLFNPWITRDVLRELPELKLTCDYSHWVCVAERLIDNELEILKLCAEHALHIHARVGYEEGPQVPDPRAPEYRGHVEAHERWWDLIWDSQQARGLEFTTLTPEFGPPNYMQTLPYTGVPVADLWDICNWQARRQAERFASRQRRAS
jgi:sugar phosphate isomerase/epimerase